MLKSILQAVLFTTDGSIFLEEEWKTKVQSTAMNDVKQLSADSVFFRSIR